MQEYPVATTQDDGIVPGLRFSRCIRGRGPRHFTTRLTIRTWSPRCQRGLNVRLLSPVARWRPSSRLRGTGRFRRPGSARERRREGEEGCRRADVQPPLARRPHTVGIPTGFQVVHLTAPPELGGAAAQTRHPKAQFLQHADIYPRVYIYISRFHNGPGDGVGFVVMNHEAGNREGQGHAHLG